MLPCPPDSDLSSFLVGPQTEPLAKHVRDCAECQTRLDAMSDDGELRRWALTARGAAEPALRQVLAAWRDAPPKFTSGDTAEHGHEVYPSDVPSLGYPGGIPGLAPGASQAAPSTA